MDVVVPSEEFSFVLFAASFTKETTIFSISSSNSFMKIPNL